MAMLQPKFAILDETDSGLDIDALRIVSDGVNRLTGPELGVLVITHYARLLQYIRPDRVHVLVEGRIVESGGPEIADKLEAHGYAPYGVQEAAVLMADTELTPKERDAVAIGEYQSGFTTTSPSRFFKSRRGLDEQIVREISAHKSEPPWMPTSAVSR